MRRVSHTSPPWHGTLAFTRRSSVVAVHLRNSARRYDGNGLDDDDYLSRFYPPDDEGPSRTRSPYDWRTCAPSRRRPGGLIDDPKMNHPRRYKFAMEPLSVGDPWHDELEKYKLRFLDLLTEEQEAVRRLIQTRLAHWPQDKLKRDGYCLSGLASFWLQANHFGKPVATFLLGPGIALPYHRFENGTQVLLSRLDPLRDLTGQGSVIGISDTEIRISFDEKLDLGEEKWRIDIFSTDIAYDRMRAAIHHFNFDPAEQERRSKDHVEPILQGTFLRDVLLSSFGTAGPVQACAPSPGVFYPDQLISSWARRYGTAGEPVLVEGDPDLGDLNVSQRRAIAMMLTERVSLVQGPPGTGKTKTIIEAVKLLKVHFRVPQPILVCTYTNVAVDNLVEGLAKSGLRPLRVGYTAKIRPTMLPHTLDTQIEGHKLKPLLNKLERQIDDLRERMERRKDKMNGLDSVSKRALEHQKMLEKMGEDLEAKKRRAWAVKMQILQDCVSNADVICTTCITSATTSLNVVDFPIVFLDEASMSTEPASLIPLMKGSRQVTLIGDHKQLPPVIASCKAEAGGLGVSLFERLTEEKNVPRMMLNVQYRMHPSLARFPSSEFYNFSLYDGTVSPMGEISAGLTPPRSSHLEIDPATGHRPSLIFLDHAGNEEIKDRSRVNYTEARIVGAVIEDLLIHNPDMTGQDIGVIAPYAAQVSLLDRLLRSNVGYRKRLENVLGPLRAMQIGLVEMKTVDGFEGREKEVVIFSTVRNNVGGHIGFLGDRRRMNVGLTRARRGLFVIGSVKTLGQGGDVWVRYVDWLAAQGAVKRMDMNNNQIFINK